jgi:hypothetical protein
MGYKQWMNSINNIQGNPDHWRMLSEDLEPKGGILSRRRQVWRYLGGKGRKIPVVSKELCYGMAETLEDTEEAAILVAV